MAVAPNNKAILEVITNSALKRMPKKLLMIGQKLMKRYVVLFRKIKEALLGGVCMSLV